MKKLLKAYKVTHVIWGKHLTCRTIIAVTLPRNPPITMCFSCSFFSFIDITLLIFTFKQKMELYCAFFLCSSLFKLVRRASVCFLTVVHNFYVGKQNFASCFFLVTLFFNAVLFRFDCAGPSAAAGFLWLQGLGSQSCRPLSWPRAQWLQLAGLAAPQHVRSSWTRDHTCVSGIGRRLSQEGSQSA